MITDRFALSAWGVQKVCPLANRSFPNFPLPRSPTHPQPGVTDLHSRTAGSLKNSSRYSAHMPNSNAGSQPEFYSSRSTTIVPGGRPRSEPCLPAPSLKTNSQSELGPPKPSCRGTDRAGADANSNPPLPPTPPPQKKLALR